MSLHQVYHDFIKRIADFKVFKRMDIAISYGGGSWQPSRYITLATDSNGSDYYIKLPKFKTFQEQKQYALYDELAFTISHTLNLNVVPVTIALEYHKNLVNAYVPNTIKPSLSLLSQNDSGEYEYLGTIVQNAVICSPDQYHLNHDIATMLTKLDIDSVHRAILFNVIVGRVDAGAVNSVVDINNRIIDVDNERIGCTTTDYWLIPHYKDTVISNTIVKQLLSHNLSNFYNLSNLSNPESILFTNVKSDEVKNNIFNNISRLIALLTKNTTVKVSDLAEIFYQEPKIEFDCQTQ
jgi:hypothetical protein